VKFIEISDYEKEKAGCEVELSLRASCLPSFPSCPTRSGIPRLVILFTGISPSLLTAESFLFSDARKSSNCPMCKCVFMLICKYTNALMCVCVYVLMYLCSCVLMYLCAYVLMCVTMYMLMCECVNLLMC